MSEMVERVGEALRKECLSIFGSTWNNDNAWRLARAAIEAMREPTQEMVDAVDLGIPTEGQIFNTWREMIDAALNEKADA